MSLAIGQSDCIIPDIVMGYVGASEDSEAVHLHLHEIICNNTFVVIPVEVMTQRALRLVISTDEFCSRTLYSLVSKRQKTSTSFLAYIDIFNGSRVPLDIFSRTFTFKGSPPELPFVAEERNGASLLHIFVQSQGMERCVSDDLPPRFVSNLLGFVKQGRQGRKGFDCLNFMSEMLDQGEQSDLTFKVVSRKSDLDELQPGTGIVLSQLIKRTYFHEDNQEKYRDTLIPKHYACLLGNGLYISLMGRGGPLLVSNLKSMKQLYHAKHVSYIV